MKMFYVIVVMKKRDITLLKEKIIMDYLIVIIVQQFQKIIF